MKKHHKIYSSMPDNFSSKINVATCYLEFKDTFLLLKRHPSSIQGNKWCLPGGKVEENESFKDGVIREVSEEVGLKLSPSTTIDLGRLYIQGLDLEFTLHLFAFSYDYLPKIELNLKEHIESKWLTYDSALSLPLITGGIKTLNHLIYLKSKKRNQQIL